MNEHFDGFAYELEDTFGARCLYRGLQVGYFAVRRSADEDAWMVDYWPARVVLIDLQLFENALTIADEVNRFSLVAQLGEAGVDVAPAASLDEFAQQVGADMVAWIESMIELDAARSPVTPYRDWLAQQKRAA